MSTLFHMAGPLKGFRILDLTNIVMGPYATQILGDLGADVIKIESPVGDDVRGLMPGRHHRMGPMFLALNRSKRSVSVDLKSPEGRDVILRLASTCDVFVSNMRPAALQRLGLGLEEIKAANRRLVVFSLVGFASNGPYGGRPAYDDLIQAAIGLPWLYQKVSGGPPQYVPLALVDRCVGMHAAMAITAALVHRERSGDGQFIELPMFESMAQMVLGDHLAGRTFEPALYASGYPRSMSPARHPYRARDGYIAVIPYSDQQWQTCFLLTGLNNVVGDDPRFADIGSRTQHIDALYELLGTAIQTKTVSEWMEIFEENDIPAMPIGSLDDLIDDPHLNATGWFQLVDHPSEGLIRMMKVPGIWSETAPEVTALAPRLGEHSRNVLIEAGFSEREVQALVSAGVLFDCAHFSTAQNR